MIRLTGDHPFNAEPNVRTLIDNPVTPTSLHYVRNHGPVPKIDWDTFRLEIGGLVKTKCSFSMDELLAMPSIEVAVTLTCCGNRREEQNMVRRSKGFKWGAGAVGTGIYKGVSLRYLLELCGIDDSRDISSLYVDAEGLDVLPNGSYGTTFVLPRALDPCGDVMVAYALNGHALPPDHGFPLRIVIPGFVGGRMIKWVSRINVTDCESSSWYHFMDNRVLPPPPVGPASGEAANQHNWWKKPEYIINERNINSVIACPEHSEVIDLRSLLTEPSATPTYLLKGYAYSGGGRQVTRVEISLDDGATWELVDRLRYDFQPRHGDKYWCWFLWEHEVDISRMMTAKDVCVRAWDASLNTQPKDITWNLLGMMNNAWYRVKISLNSNYTLTFRHPTNVGGKTPGWMVSGEDALTATSPPKVPSKAAVLKPNLASFTLSEIAKHNTKASCWIILDGLVVDCTDYLRIHPGGESAILLKGGSDASEAFNSIHSRQAKLMTEKYVIGKVDTADPPVSTMDAEPMAISAASNSIANGEPGGHAPSVLPISTQGTVMNSDALALNSSGLPSTNGNAVEVTREPTIVSSGQASEGTCTIAVVGLGMVALRFCEKILEYDLEKKYRLVVFGEEPFLAYNRVGLTNYFSHRSIPEMLMTEAAWYANNNVELHLGDLVKNIDPSNKLLTSASGVALNYDKCVLATGSSAMVPPLKGKEHEGVFVYRTIDDLNRIIRYAEGKRTAVVVGGGLLGLEAAKACHDLGLSTTVLERSPWLMRRQLDQQAGEILAAEISKLGITVIVGCNTREIISDGHGRAQKIMVDLSLQENDCETLGLDVEIVILSCGIVPRDELGKSAGLTLAPRGGIIVDDLMRTSADDVFGIGECVIHDGMHYGLVAPGYDMADVVATNLVKQLVPPKAFTGADMSTKLKLLGVNVASFGNYFADDSTSRAITHHDPFSGTYRRLIMNPDGTKLLGGILVGDTADYGKLLALTKSTKPLTQPPSELFTGKRAGTASATETELDDDAQICSCNNVTKGNICKTIREQNLSTVDQVKKCTKAGTSCGGCVPTVTEIFNKELAKLGRTVVQHICEHFKFSRTELYEIIKIKGYRTFYELIKSHGQGFGCEVCKPAVASILASLYNDHVLDHASLQDTNDKYLANIQRDGSFSVVPRIAGGEVTTDGLIVMGQIAKEFNLYLKISGGQRIVMFGAQKQDLPTIWEKLVNAGFETGHAYGKSLRTVKSCVGSEWCRYGMRDSVRFAIEIEHRYKGLRSPHKIKSAVSGCIRECAEAQNKDFGLIATDKGYNLYVCGNGGSKPKHAVLLATEISEELVIKYVDRFLMYYIKTADKLMRTARWLEKLPGGIDYLRQVVVDDRLGIAEELERQMQYLVDTYQDEWATVVKDPVRRQDFRQFINTTETETSVARVKDKIGQERPAHWPSDKASRSRVHRQRQGKLGAAKTTSQLNADPAPDSEDASGPFPSLPAKSTWQWTRVASTKDVPKDGGAVVKRGKTQIAIYNFTSINKWYATQNMCPHKRAFVLAQGILGTTTTTKETAGLQTEHLAPKVSCPMHKKNFSLEDGKCMTGEQEYDIQAFEVKIVEDNVWLLLPDERSLDAVLGTDVWKITSDEADSQWAIGVEVAGVSDGKATNGCSSDGCGDPKLEW
ncbi:hypothetical protein HDU85_006531 [Gaertneriomyces sp. JEL0708]|nr:hypothetical protein HDU85_006531 [Gaertneriomyces sp. JEL0708]